MNVAICILHERYRLTNKIERIVPLGSELAIVNFIGDVLSSHEMLVMALQEVVDKKWPELSDQCARCGSA